MDKVKTISTEFGGANLLVVKADFIEALTSKIEQLSEQVFNLSTTKQPIIYNNTSIKELLGIQDRLLKKYRDDGLLAYHQVGDKYWYTREDVEQFLANSKYEAYALAS